PRLSRWEFEFLFGPRPQCRNRWWRANQAQIQFAIVYRRLAGISFGQKLQHNAISEVARERNVRLQCNPLALGARQEVAQPSHGGIASVRSDYYSRGECLSHDVDLPIFGGGPIERDQRCFLANFGSECARPIEEKMVKQAALDRDHAAVAARKLDPQFFAANGNKVHGIEGSVRAVPD